VTPNQNPNLSQKSEEKKMQKMGNNLNTKHTTPMNRNEMGTKRRIYAIRAAAAAGRGRQEKKKKQRGHLSKPQWKKD